MPLTLAPEKYPSQADTKLEMASGSVWTGNILPKPLASVLGTSGINYPMDKVVG
jgi:hypothetical protein